MPRHWLYEAVIRELARVVVFLDKTKREIIDAAARALADSVNVDKQAMLSVIYRFKQVEVDYEKLKAEIVRSLGGRPEEVKGKDLEEVLRYLLAGPRPAERILVGVIGTSLTKEGREALKVLEKLRKAGLPGGVLVEDFSTDVLSVADIINDVSPEVLVLVSVAVRGRPPGVYVSRVKLERRENAFEALEDVRPSLEGWISIDAIVAGLPAFLKHEPREVVIVECEPGAGSCADELYREVIRVVRGAAR